MCKAPGGSIHALRYLPNIRYGISLFIFVIRYSHAVFRYSYSLFVISIRYSLFISVTQMRYSKLFSSNTFLNCNEQRWSRGHKARGQGHKKNPRPRTAFPRTDTLEAKDTSASALQKKKKKKKVFTKIFQAISKKKKKKKKGLHKNFSSDLHKKTFSKKFFKRFIKF